MSQAFQVDSLLDILGEFQNGVFVPQDFNVQILAFQVVAVEGPRLLLTTWAWLLNNQDGLAPSASFLDLLTEGLGLLVDKLVLYLALF